MTKREKNEKQKLYIRDFRRTSAMLCANEAVPYKTDLAIMNKWTERWLENNKGFEREWALTQKNALLFFAYAHAKDMIHFNGICGQLMNNGSIEQMGFTKDQLDLMGIQLWQKETKSSKKATYIHPGRLSWEGQPLETKQ